MSTLRSKHARPKGRAPARAGRAIGVVVVDDDPLTRAGILAVVGGQDNIRILGEMANVNAAIAHLPSWSPDVVLIEACLGSGREGAAIRAILRSVPGTKVIAFGSGRREEEIFHVLNAGVVGYVIRGSIDTELVAAVRETGSGQRYIPAQIQRLLENRHRRSPLTRRERSVLLLLAEARSNATIATMLGISVGTVKLHVKAVLKKLGVEDRAEAAVVAVERGFCPPR